MENRTDSCNKVNRVKDSLLNEEMKPEKEGDAGWLHEPGFSLQRKSIHWTIPMEVFNMSSTSDEGIMCPVYILQ